MNIWKIEKMAEMHDIKGLTKALLKENGKHDVRTAAAKALGELNDPRAIESLIKVLDFADNWIARDMVINVLEKLNAAGPLINALNHQDWRVRCAVIPALKRLNAAEPLIKSLSDNNPDVRKDAAKALGELKDPRAVEPLIEALNDKGEYVREAAAKALGELKNLRADAVLKALNLNSGQAMMYLFVLFSKHDLSIAQNQVQFQQINSEIENGYRKHYGPHIKLLGGNFVDSLPTSPDAFVVTTCLLTCKQNNISFNSAKDEISYSVDTVLGISAGVCRITIK